MLRTTKWKLEKAKVKVVFRLQFHATNIPPSGWEKLFICFIPAESGKIIAKTSKANVRNGTCKWPDPIYETTRLLIDSRNKRYEDKLYNLIVGMGSSHASILGEAIINLADYADASNPFVVALPLHGSDQGTILHVTVQLLTAKTGFREFEQQFDRGLHSSSYLNRVVEPSIATSSFSELQISDDHKDKVNTKTHFGSESKELITAADQMGIHEEFSESPIEYNGSCDASKSHYESQDGSARTQDQPTEKADFSADNDLASAHEENHRLRGNLKMAESFIFDLKQELNALHNHANQMNMETQKISQHLTDEISSGLKLERDIMILRSECSKLKDELEQLKEVKLRSSCTRGFDMGEGQSLELLSQLDEAKAERGNLVKKMNEMECYYEALVQELEENRDRILGEFQRLRYEHSTCVYTISTCKAETESIRQCMKDQILKFEKERYALGCVNEEIEKRAMVAEARVQELDENHERVLGEFRTVKNEHSRCKALVQDLEKKRELILGEFQSLKDEHLTCGDIISACKAQSESIRGDMNVQTLKFAKERHDLCCVNEELEKRVMAAEELVQDLEKNRELILGEFQSLKNEHLTCADTILTFKTETESIRHHMNDQIMKFGKERHDLGCVEKLEKKVSELEENRKQILEKLEKIKNEHSTFSQDMKDNISKFAKEKHDLSCVNEKLEKTVSELKENRKQIVKEFHSLKVEHLTCADTIMTCKTETESIRHDMNDRILKFKEDKHVLEKRVTTLESALEKARLNYSIAVTHLQKDLDMLSFQVSSMFETNQNLIKQTFSKSSIPLSEKCPKTIKISDEQISEIFHENLYLDVYSVTLQEKLFEVSIEYKNKHEGKSESLRIAFMKEQCETTVQELKQQLFVSKRHGNDVLIKLQDALDEIESRKKSEASYLKKIEELSLKIAGFESELQSIQAELDCALLNLECCKEEKAKIVASMQESEEEKLKIVFELSLLQEQISQKDSMTSSVSCFQDLQRELVQLDKANEELGTMYPKFKDFPGDGNALERVLALEIELAGALTAKKKSSIQFQSSFLKQHTDEEAVFKSFRDINELIKDTLDIRSKYENVETELNEMHERYSQLSLQFAEVEGERQKLMMTIKNARSPRNRFAHETLDANLL